MVRIFFLVSVLYIFAFCDSIDSKIQSFVGAGYESKKAIIDVIMGDKKRYIKDNGKIDSVEIIKVLKNNGLIKLTLNKPKDVKFTFEVKGEAILFLRIINNILNFMGFNYYDIKSVKKEKDSLSLSIVMSTEYIIDPTIMSEELRKRGCELQDITKQSSTDWIYKISVKDGKIFSKEILNDITYKLKKPIKPYWLSLSQGKKIQFSSFSLNRWHPYICFLDSELNVIKVYKKDDRISKLELNIPKNTKYVMVSDIYTLSNIRIGLKVYVSSE